MSTERKLAVISIIVAWSVLVVGLTLDSPRVLAVALFCGLMATVVTSWVVTEHVAGKVAMQTARRERIEVEKMASVVAEVLVQEYKLGRFPPGRQAG